MTPFAIRWNIDDRKLRELRSNLNLERIRRLYFEDAGLQWRYVLLGWPDFSDGTPLRLPDGQPFSLLINVVFERFQGAGANQDVARVDAQELLTKLVQGPHGTRFPYEGTMRIDLEDIDKLLTDRPRFKDTVVHEVGHVLGLGTLFHPQLVRTDDRGDWYTGTNGCRAYAKLLAAQKGQEVPLQTEQAGTTHAYHWDEQALPRDIMSTHLDQPGVTSDGLTGAPSIDLINVISPVSAGALMDLGYLVDMTKATRTKASPQRTPPSQARTRTP